MNIVLLVSVVVCMMFQNVLGKVYTSKNPSGGTFSFNTVSCMAAAIFFAVTAGGSLNFDKGVLLYSAAFAISYSTTLVFSVLAIKAGSLALTSLVISYSLVIPTLSGIILFNEKTTLILWIGIALLLISLGLINSKDKGDVKITLKWIIYVFITFVANGMNSTIQQLQQRQSGGAYKNEFMLIAFLLAVVILAIYTLVCERKTIVQDLKKGALTAVGAGISGGIVNLFVIILVASMNSSILFPVISAGGIVATAFVAVVFYKEKLSAKQYIAMILGIVAIVLLNL